MRENPSDVQSQPAARCWAVIPAAGIGSRMGGECPKQYLEIAGRTLLEHSLASVLASDQIEAVVVAVHPEDSRPATLPAFSDSRVYTVTGAEQRAGSVLAGIKALLNDVSGAHPGDWVLVHDAARPCLLLSDLERLLAQVIGGDVGGILAQPLVDTVKLSGDNQQVKATLDRERLWRAQTPQMFRIGELHAALETGLAAQQAITDEASAMELAGHPVQLVSGSRSNIKVTVPGDLALAAFYLGGAGVGESI